MNKRKHLHYKCARQVSLLLVICIGHSPRDLNQVAEFRALREGLIAFQRHTAGLDSYLKPIRSSSRSASLTVIGDSDLVVKIMSGVWHPHPNKLYYDAWAEAAATEWGRVHFRAGAASPQTGGLQFFPGPSPRWIRPRRQITAYHTPLDFLWNVCHMIAGATPVAHGSDLSIKYNRNHVGNVNR